MAENLRKIMNALLEPNNVAKMSLNAVCEYPDYIMLCLLGASAQWAGTVSKLTLQKYSKR